MSEMLQKSDSNLSRPERSSLNETPEFNALLARWWACEHADDSLLIRRLSAELKEITVQLVEKGFTLEQIRDAAEQEMKRHDKP